MQIIEKWRVRELALVLRRIAFLLRDGGGIEWSNVFLHYSHEAKAITERPSFDMDGLRRLVLNITECFNTGSSLRTLKLAREKGGQGRNLNGDFLEARNELFRILSEMGGKWEERIH